MPTFTADDGQLISFTDTGAPAKRPDAPAVVFGHGLLFSGWMFRAQVKALRREYRCVTIDWRGQGDTPPARDGYDMDRLSEDAIDLIARLEAGPVHYVGLSMGGFVGQRIAARRPELIRSLTLLDTSAEHEYPRNAVEDTLLAHIYLVAGMAPVRGQVEKVMFGPTFRNDPAGRAVIDEWTQLLEHQSRRGIRNAVMGVVLRKPVLPELPNITAPTLVAVGADDVPTPVARSRKIVEHIKGARLEIVPHCGHSSSLEQPDVITHLIREHLAGN
jgi:pimeloyl-ACP methyl ester carboxylesterase